MSTARRPRTPSTKRRGAARPLSPDDCSIAQLKEELHCRACRLPTDPRLAGHDSRLLATTMHRMEKGIYGTDDRSEVFEVSDQAIRQNARSVAAITGVERLVDLGDGSYRLGVDLTLTRLPREFSDGCGGFGEHGEHRNEEADPRFDHA